MNKKLKREQACKTLMDLLKESLREEKEISDILKEELIAHLSLDLRFEVDSDRYLEKYAADIRSSDLDFNRSLFKKGFISRQLPTIEFYNQMVYYMLNHFPYSYLSNKKVIPFARSGLDQFSLDRLDNSVNHFENFSSGLLRVCTVTEQHLFPRHCKNWTTKKAFLYQLAHVLLNSHDDLIDVERARSLTLNEKR
jgi:hypothetical protein